MVYWWQYFILPQVCGCVAAGHAVTVVLEGEVLAIVPLVLGTIYGVTKHVWLKLVVVRVVSLVVVDHVVGRSSLYRSYWYGDMIFPVGN